MRRVLSLVAMALICVGSPVQGREPPDEPPGWLVKDLNDLASLLEGRWSNDAQLFFAEELDLDPADRPPPQTLFIQSVGSDPGAEQAGGARHLMSLRWRELDALQAISLDLLADASNGSIRQVLAGESETPACRVVWARSAGHFHGVSEGPGCGTYFPSPAGEGKATVSLFLSTNEFWIGSVRGEARLETRLRRARPFTCWTAVLRGAGHGDSGEGLEDWDFRRGVELHDQGGEAEIVTDEAPPRRIRLKLRDVVWPYGTRRPSLTLYVLEGESDRAVSYAWTEGGAERIGINLRWLQASCTHTPDGG